ncbi:MAG: 50S ribosomal protein L24 [Chloroflexi bacterium]|nr:50S ribosomal protein L24 [Chloroflexota bacterium]
MKIRKDDTVEVISGDDKGARGKVNTALPKEERVVVAGVNLVKKHQRRTSSVRTQTGIIEREAPISVSNVALVCPHCSKATRVAYQVAPDGSKARVCRKCGETIE